jgi:outer membrane protein OmpA-like peptidoglycan-associated protein
MKLLLSKRFDKIAPKGMAAILVLLCILITGQATAQNSGVGSHAAPFLKVSPAARQVALGGAFTALTNDINVMRYNIGGLGGLQHTSFGINFNTWIDDTQQGNLSFGIPFSFGAVGVDVSYFNEGQITKLDPDFVATGGEAISGDVMFSVGYGKFLHNMFNIENMTFGLGGAFKYLNQSLVGETSSVSALDVGAQLHFPQYISLGASIQNYGFSNVKFDNWESPLPTTYRFGTALNFPINKWQLIVSSDASWVTKEKIKYQLGSELVVNRVFALRGGYKFNDASMSNWAVGFGVFVPTEWLARSKMRLDYAYAPLAAFDQAAHRFSMHFAFGSIISANQLSAEDVTELSSMQEQLRRELEAAEKNRLLASETAARLDSLEKEMRERLARIEAIAAESEGKIEVEPQADGKKILVTMRINFDFDKANIRPDENSIMQQVGEILNTYPEAKVHLSGHTDWVGSDLYNIHLSHRRVDSVRTYLSKRERVSFRRFFMPVGYGESKPVETNETDEGRFRNRRVEFLLFTFDSKPEMPVGTAIMDVKAIDSRTIQIVCNGKVPAPTKTMSLIKPNRFVVDFEKIYLIAKDNAFQLNNGPFIRARLAFHDGGGNGDYTRVVLDVKNAVQAEITSEDNFIYIRLK